MHINYKFSIYSTNDYFNINCVIMFKKLNKYIKLKYL